MREEVRACDQLADLSSEFCCLLSMAGADVFVNIGQRMAAVKQVEDIAVSRVDRDPIRVARLEIKDSIVPSKHEQV